MDAITLILILAGVAAIAGAVIYFGKKKTSPTPTPAPVPVVDPIVPAPAVVLSTYILTTTKSDAGSGLITSDAVTASCTGDFSAGRYEWKQVSGDTSVTLSNQIGDTTKFSRTVADKETAVAVFQCVGTDVSGKVLQSNPVTVVFKGFGA